LRKCGSKPAGMSVIAGTRVMMRQRIERELSVNFTAYKVLNGICVDV
jgi:hypothetical protein